MLLTNILMLISLGIQNHVDLVHFVLVCHVGNEFLIGCQEYVVLVVCGSEMTSAIIVSESTLGFGLSF